jgi:hypothetical protein
MKWRCANPNCPGYINYGGRGIVVCKEWEDDYSAFRDWAIANGYSEGLQIDRKNNNKGYSPENCRFVTRSQNNKNRRARKNGSSRFKGVSYMRTRKKWLACIRHDGRTKNLGHYATALAAALAYDDFAYDHYTEYAGLNFPERKKKNSMHTQERK